MDEILSTERPAVEGSERRLQDVICPSRDGEFSFLGPVGQTKGGRHVL